MYPNIKVRENVAKVREALYEIYEEYVREYQCGGEHSAETHVLDSGMNDVNIKAFSSSWSEFTIYVISVGTILPQQSDLDVYFVEGCFICKEDSSKFDALE